MSDREHKAGCLAPAIGRCTCDIRLSLSELGFLFGEIEEAGGTWTATGSGSPTGIEARPLTVRVFWMAHGMPKMEALIPRLRALGFVEYDRSTSERRHFIYENPHAP